MVNQATLVDRMMRAARADVHLYEEVERDQSATPQAATVVAIVAGAGAIGALIAGLIAGRNPIFGLIVGLVGAFLGWILWSYVTYFVGTRLFGGTATPGEMLRTLGFAQTPQIAGILAFIPAIGPFIALLAALWSLWLAIVAIRQALDFDTGKAIITAIIGWIIVLVINLIVLAPLALLGGAARP